MSNISMNVNGSKITPEKVKNELKKIGKKISAWHNSSLYFAVAAIIMQIFISLIFQIENIFRLPLHTAQHIGFWFIWILGFIFILAGGFWGILQKKKDGILINSMIVVIYILLLLNYFRTISR